MTGAHLSAGCDWQNEVCDLPFSSFFILFPSWKLPLPFGSQTWPAGFSPIYVHLCSFRSIDVHVNNHLVQRYREVPTMFDYQSSAATPRCLPCQNWINGDSSCGKSGKTPGFTVRITKITPWKSKFHLVTPHFSRLTDIIPIFNIQWNMSSRRVRGWQHGFQVGPEDPPRQVAAVLEEVGAASFEVPRGRPDAGGRGEKDAGGAGAQRWWGWGCFEVELVKGAWENANLVSLLMGI